MEYLTGCGLQPGLTDPRSCDRQLWDFAFAGADISEELCVYSGSIHVFVASTSHLLHIYLTFSSYLSYVLFVSVSHLLYTLSTSSPLFACPIICVACLPDFIPTDVHCFIYLPHTCFPYTSLLAPHATKKRHKNPPQTNPISAPHSTTTSPSPSSTKPPNSPATPTQSSRKQSTPLKP